MKTNDFEARIDTALADLYERESRERYYLSSSQKSLDSYIERHGEDHPNTKTMRQSVEKHTAALAAIVAWVEVTPITETPEQVLAVYEAVLKQPDPADEPDEWVDLDD